MPSGAKKRKAAKKKKGLQTQDPNSTLSIHGEGDLKHEDKESDSEDGSPASQDHQNRENPFTVGEVENGEKKSDGHENESDKVQNEVERVGKEDGGVVEVERELKIGGEPEEGRNVEYVEPVVEAYKGELQRSSSSSSSSSSEEIYAVGDKNDVVVDNAGVVELVNDNGPSADTEVIDSPVITDVVSGSDKAAISEDVVQVTPSADNVASIVEPVVKEEEQEMPHAVDEKGAASNAVTDNLEEKLDRVVDKTTVSEVLVQKGLEKRDEVANAVSCEGTPVSNGSATASTDANASANLENEDKVALPHNAPSNDVGVGADNLKGTPDHESHDRQSAVTHLPPRPVQTTSWKGCCGLFELFAGSDR